MNKFRVLITGCSSGLGLHLANKFEQEGHFVFRHEGRKHFDLTNSDEIKKLSQEAKKQQIDVLINNAAIVCPNILLEKYDADLIDSMIEVNLKAPIILTKNLLSNLKGVININSMVGLEVKTPRTLYSATKWGLRGFSNSFKKENNVKVLDVYPTNIKTTPDRINAMDIDWVVDKIYNAFIEQKEELILDGRKI
jgi:short-subunit dehydrogenase